MRYTPKPVHLAILTVVLISFIALCGCTSNSPPSSATPVPTQTQVSGATTVSIQNFAFIPVSVTVTKGTTVTWVNQDSTDHQIASDTPGIFGSNSLPKGAGYSFKFDTPGTYPYHCAIHPSMKATVIVT